MSRIGEPFSIVENRVKMLETAADLAGKGLLFVPKYRGIGYCFSQTEDTGRMD